MTMSNSRNKLHYEYVKFLKNPIGHQRNYLQDRQMKFLLTFLGNRFIVGYRIQQFISPTFIILSLMQFNCFKEQSIEISKNKKQQTNYQIISLQYNDIDRQKRIQLYQKLKQICSYLGTNLSIYILYLKKSKYSKLSLSDLDNLQSPYVNKFYQKKYLSNRNNSYRRVQKIKQGDIFHKLIQFFIKGGGKLRNQNYFYRNILSNHDLNYQPQCVLNTLFFIVGKEMIMGGYVTMSSQKWMRKQTVKKFRRYDLILRNQNQVCVLDWKFTDRPANQQIQMRRSKQTNKDYYQLAKKQYKAQVKLKYICIHSEFEPRQPYHKYSQAQYQYQASLIQLNQAELNQDDPNSQDIRQISFIQTSNRERIINQVQQIENPIILRKFNFSYQQS